jgi:hypothetical protein
MIFWLLLALSIAACHQNTGKHTENDKLLGQMEGTTTKTLLKGLLGDFKIGDPESIQKFSNLKPEERALLMITADNFAAPYPQFQETRIPFVVIKSRDVEVKSIFQNYHEYKTETEVKHLPPEDVEQMRNLIDFFTTQTKGKECETIMPFNPFTKKKPWLVERELSPSNNHLFDLLAFPSMSRSVFVLNRNYKSNKLPLLFSVKAGTDTVISAGYYGYQLDKLKGLQEHVARVNLFNEKSSIPWLLTEHDVVVLSDTVGINYAQKSAAIDDLDANNGVLIRAYTTVLKDTSRVYIPMERYFNLKQDKIGPYWPLYEDGQDVIRLRVKDEMLREMSISLAEQFGKIGAIYYANGFTSKDLHNQNVLIGIPIDPSMKPRIALRDLSDHAEFPMMINGKESKVLADIIGPKWNTFHFRAVEDVLVNNTPRFNHYIGKMHEDEGFKEVIAKLGVKGLYGLSNSYGHLRYAEEGSDLYHNVIKVRNKRLEFISRSQERQVNRLSVRPKTMPYSCAQVGLGCSRLAK